METPFYVLRDFVDVEDFTKRKLLVLSDVLVALNVRADLAVSSEDLNAEGMKFYHVPVVGHKTSNDCAVKELVIQLVSDRDPRILAGFPEFKRLKLYEFNAESLEIEPRPYTITTLDLIESRLGFERFSELLLDLRHIGLEC